MLPNAGLFMHIYCQKEAQNIACDNVSQSRSFDCTHYLLCIKNFWGQDCFFVHQHDRPYTSSSLHLVVLRIVFCLFFPLFDLYKNVSTRTIISKVLTRYMKTVLRITINILENESLERLYSRRDAVSNYTKFVVTISSLIYLHSSLPSGKQKKCKYVSKLAYVPWT